MATIAEALERATNILTGEIAGDGASARAFEQWLDGFRVERPAWDAAYEQWDAQWGADYRTHTDGWDTLYIFGPEATLIKDQGRNCYIVPVASEGGAPDVRGGAWTGLDREEADAGH